MTVNLNWAAIAATLSAVAGAVGLVVTSIWGATDGSAAKAILLAVSGLLVAIPTWHVASVAAAKAKYNHLAKMAALRPNPVTLEDLQTLGQAG